MARCFLGGELVGGEMAGYRDKGRDNKAHTHTIDRCGNRKM